MEPRASTDFLYVLYKHHVRLCANFHRDPSGTGIHMWNRITYSGAPLGAPRKFLAPFGGLTRFPLHFQSILRRLEGLKRLKTHGERLPPHRLLAGAKGGAQGGSRSVPSDPGGELTPCPPLQGGSGETLLRRWPVGGLYRGLNQVRV